jgi:predicted AAA+ superfamily ATPase
LIHKAERYNVAGKELLNGNCKYYANDSAYYNYLYKGFAYGLGNLLENAVYIELRRKGWQLYVGVQGQTEIDFVAMRSDEKVYFQVSWQIASNEETAQREYAP